MYAYISYVVYTLEVMDFFFTMLSLFLQVWTKKNCEHNMVWQEMKLHTFSGKLKFSYFYLKNHM